MDFQTKSIIRTRKHGKILILLKNIEGGTGTFLNNFLKNTINEKIRFEYHTLVLEKPKFQKYKLSNLEFFSNKKYEEKTFSFNFRNLWQFVTIAVWVTRIIRKNCPDIIIAVDSYSNLLVSFCRIFFLSSKLVLTTHINLSSTLKEKSSKTFYFILNRVVCYFYNKADMIIAISKGVATDLRSNFHIKKAIKTIYYGIPAGIFKSKKINSNKVIFSAARLDNQKDFQTLLSAFALLVDELPNTRLLIAGEGPLKKEIIKLIRQYNLGKNVKLLGWVNDMNNIFNKSDLFVLSSKREGFGYVLLESMSQSVPVISSDSAFGPGELLDHGKYGLLFPVGDYKTLKSQMKMLLTNSQEYRYYSKMAFKRSLFFSIEKMQKNYHKLLVELLQKKRT